MAIENSLRQWGIYLLLWSYLPFTLIVIFLIQTMVLIVFKQNTDNVLLVGILKFISLYFGCLKIIYTDHAYVEWK